jgi:DNA-binding winged helix-turn-helix (wHTH) protein/TolB-like protein
MRVRIAHLIACTSAGRVICCRMYRFGDRQFDQTTGELTFGENRERLTPQTARVLELLLEHAGAIVPREEFHRRLWPNATVEFDQGLNFCIRQLRIALADDATAPTFIETLPRRGYRFRGEVTAVGLSTETSAASTATHRRSPTVAIAAAIVCVAIALFTVATYTYTNASTQPVLAIVPFDVDTNAPESRQYRDRLMEAVIERATARAARQLTIVGPGYTARFGSRTPIDTLHGVVGAGFAVSGAVHRRGAGFEIFAQLVRAKDRGHLWVIRVVDSSAAQVASIGAQIGDSIAAIATNKDPRTPRGYEQRRPTR